MSECPICGVEISLAADTVVGELLDCTDCDSELEVTELNQQTLAEATESEEDWGEGGVDCFIS